MDTPAYELVKVQTHWPAKIPANGFEWVQGIEQRLAGSKNLEGDFLIGRPGPLRFANFPDDLYIDFAHLAIEKDAIRQFANQYGTLRVTGQHFHRMDGGGNSAGEPLRDWSVDLQRFRQTFDLWCGIKYADLHSVKRSIGLLKRGLMRPPSIPTSEPPFKVGISMVVNTINYGIGVHHRRLPPCAICGLTFGLPWASETRGQVRANSDGSFDLTISSTDLVTSMWLQLAALVGGERTLKKCAAPDCTRRYMDVSKSKRPGARRMHPSCEERIRKQNYRKRKKARNHEK